MPNAKEFTIKQQNLNAKTMKLRKAEKFQKTNPCIAIERSHCIQTQETSFQIVHCYVCVLKSSHAMEWSITLVSFRPS